MAVRNEKGGLLRISFNRKKKQKKGPPMKKKSIRLETTSKNLSALGGLIHFNRLFERFVTEDSLGGD